jgi:hypothetical protein
MGQNKNKNQGGNKKNNSPTKIAGINIGNKLGPGEIRKLESKGVSIPQIINKVENKGVKVSTAGKNVLYPQTPASTATQQPDTFNSYDTSTDTSNYISGPTYDYATTLAEIAGQQATTSINANSLIEVERIRQAGESERAKWDIDSRIPTIQAEAKGKMDLQAIVNAGYKNIANIERGSNMFSSIMGAFNF